MYEIRMPEETRKKLDCIEQIREPVEFFRNIVDLMNNYYKSERYEPVKYDEDTGKPKLVEWKPYDKFSGVIYLHGGFTEYIRLSRTMRGYLEDIMKGEPHIYRDGETTYVISEFKANYDGYMVCAGVQIRCAVEVI